jgi:hypothetical protein
MDVLVCENQLLPPSVVFIIKPLKPTDQPVFSSIKNTSYLVVSGAFGCQVHDNPPSVVL